MVITVSKTDRKKFENEVNKLLNDGYDILSSSCGYIGEVGGNVYDYEYWMAILKKYNCEV